MGVSPNSTEAEIKAAYKKLALKHHPDRNQGSKKSEEIFKQIVEAYTTLSNQSLRRDYDLKLLFEMEKSRRKPTQADPFVKRNYGVPDMPPPPSKASAKQREENEKAKAAEKADSKAFMLFLTIFVCGIVGLLAFWAIDAYKRKEAKSLLINNKPEAAIRVDAEYADAWLALGKQYFLSQKYLQAEGAYTKCIKFQENSTKAPYKERAEVLMVQRKFEEALQDLKIAESLSGGNDSLKWVIAQLLVQKVKRYSESLDVMGKISDKSPYTYLLTPLKAEAFFHLRKLKMALFWAEIGLKNEATKTECRFWKAMVLVSNNKSKEACSLFDECSKEGMPAAGKAMDVYCNP